MIFNKQSSFYDEIVFILKIGFLYVFNLYKAHRKIVPIFCIVRYFELSKWPLKKTHKQNVSAQSKM